MCILQEVSDSIGKVVQLLKRPLAILPDDGRLVRVSLDNRSKDLSNGGICVSVLPDQQLCLQEQDQSADVSCPLDGREDEEEREKRTRKKEKEREWDEMRKKTTMNA